MNHGAPSIDWSREAQGCIVYEIRLSESYKP
jgi:hypothetical protein